MAKKQAKKTRKSIERSESPAEAPAPTEPRVIYGWCWPQALDHGPPLQIYASPIMEGAKPADRRVRITEVLD